MTKVLRRCIYLLILSVLFTGCTNFLLVNKDQFIGNQTNNELTKTMKNIRVASFNIKYGERADYDFSKIADIIKGLDLDIVGIQEVDYMTARSGEVDQPAVIAEAAGMKYYQFCRCIDYDGGEYGTLILSKYPIESSKIYPLESKNYESRTLGYAQIEVDGVRVDFFNTHLSYEENEVRAEQLRQIKDIMSDYGSFILVGDMNIFDLTELDMLGASLINRAERLFDTFPESQTAIDNIIFSDRYTEVGAGMYETTYSDHNLIWAELLFVVE